MNTCSTLYTILKSDDTLKIPKLESPPKPVVKKPRIETKGTSLWQCWNCSHIFRSEGTLSTHLKQCKGNGNTQDELQDCPFCPPFAIQPSEVPFSLNAFNLHMSSNHPDIKTLMCCYCLESVHSPRLEDLTAHILTKHQIPWRPSPLSLAYLRETQLPHRVVTCLGCGWCTFVLRANSAAQPPNTLETHMSRCAFSGGRVHLTRLPKDVLESTLGILETTEEADKIANSFSQTYPLVRGYSKNSEIPRSPIRLHRYIRDVSNTPDQVNGDKPTGKRNANNNRSRISGNLKSSTKKSPGPRQNRKKKEEKKNVIFDIPLDIPPPPPPCRAGYKKDAPTRLYVCPLCGDNALASLRERDEHLQAAHDGELVFPCQICGVAYPFYIALRRHAAHKHDSDFDGVRYGPAYLLDSEPIECPECQLVAFQDAAVLKLHLAHVHKIDSDDPSPVEDISKKDDHTDSDSRPEVKNLLSLLKNPDAKSRPKIQPKVPKNRSKPLCVSETENQASPRITSDIKKPVTAITPTPAPFSRLEVMLSSIDGSPAQCSCRFCRTVLENPKELCLHKEIEHGSSESNCEQLGCQACGRVFFGPGCRIDLIGHLRVIHQDNSPMNLLKCPHSNKHKTEDRNADSNQKDVDNTSIGYCNALFSSPRLRHLHLAASVADHPRFVCPMQSPSLSESDYKSSILECEILADEEGLMILAYCCPNCSRLFAGFGATSRFSIHQSICGDKDNTNTSDLSQPASDNVAFEAVNPTTPQPNILASVLTAVESNEENVQQ